jgi:hypothetical protein
MPILGLLAAAVAFGQQGGSGDTTEDDPDHAVKVSDDVLWHLELGDIAEVRTFRYTGSGRAARNTPVILYGYTCCPAAVPSDFNGDGIPDIVWHNRDTGSSGIWFMDRGTRILGSAGLPGWADGDVNWWIAGVADFNGDGKPDLLWRNYGNGRNAVWLLDGTTVISVLELPALPDVT